MNAGGRLLIGGRMSFLLATAALGGAAIALVVLALADRLGAAASFLLLALALVGGAGAVLGWRRAVRAAAAAVAADEARVEEVEQAARAEGEEREARLRDVQRTLELTREWNRTLRERMLELQWRRGALGDTSDARRLVLKVAIELLGAEKGLLLSHEDLDGDGDLDLVVAEGFEHDPGHSRVCQRFAREVLARDETVREDDHPDDTPADREIDNLVAIPIYLRDRFHGVVICCNRPGGFHEHDDGVLLALGDHAGAVLQNAYLHGALRGSYLATVSMLADAVQAKDPLTRGHSDQVAKLVGEVAARLGLEADRREQLLFASLLHDLGKIGISERILLKPGPLTREERSIVELHPRIGYRLVGQVPALREMAPAILHHHERWDGGGYPSGLRGEEIPLEARVIAVADSFSSMIEERPYRERRDVAAACAELERCAGEQFDPEIVRVFVSEVRRVPERVQALERRAGEDVFDPELEVRRSGDEPVLGFGSISLVDNVTLLYSHRHLYETAGAEASRAAVQERPFAVLMLKLTELERVNRERGYAAGDRELATAARALERLAGRCGGTACRFGGACLAVVVPGAHDDVAEQLCDELATDLADGPSVRFAHAVWQPGDSGEDVVARARTRLRQPAAA